MVMHKWSQSMLPQHTLSRCYGKLVNSKSSLLKNALIKSFIWRYGVDMSEALREDISAYSDFNDFFTRQLKAEARPIAQAANQLACPVDGAVSQIGSIDDDQLLQAKGATYSLASLLADDKELIAQFKHGSFATLYLAPKDYHRVHMPMAGQLQQMIFVPGRLFSVSKKTATHIPNLFARNERVICVFATAAGPMVVILVGAMIVASMATAWHGVVTPAAQAKIAKWQYPQAQDQAIQLEKGAELGHFKVGSTVIVLLPEGRVRWNEAIQADSNVKFGQELGTLEL